jgi:hypothetical protein
VNIDEGVRQTLRYDVGSQFIWKSATPDRSSAVVDYLFFFRWNAGSSSVLRARAHRPDICLPSIGWRQVADLGLKTYRTSDNLAIPARHAVFSQPGNAHTAHTFFCLQEDRIGVNRSVNDSEFEEGVQPDWGPAGRLRGVEKGIRNLGQQILEIVITSGEPLTDAAAEQLFTDALREVAVPATGSR